MLTQLHLDRWADVLVRHATKVRPGNIVRINAQSAAEPLLEAVYRKVLEAGGHPVVNCRPDFPGEAFYELAEKLMTGSELHFQTPAGTDLKVDTAGMRWLSSPGRKNFPDGEVYSGPNLNAGNGGADGVVFFDNRCVYQGHAVRNARITMENGRATDVTAEEGEDFLIAMLDQDEGARRIGEVAFGTNRAISQPSGQILYDEKMGGSFHLAFGAGYPETGNVNKSALHWDLIASLTIGSLVTLDDQPFCVDGRFVDMPPEVTWI